VGECLVAFEYFDAVQGVGDLVKRVRLGLR
jgi:hypothetical protein